MSSYGFLPDIHAYRLWIVMWLLSGSSISAMRGKGVKPRFAARGGFEGNLIFHLLGLSLVPIRRLRGYTWRR
jgi:hypothetical protein